jgi:hypothetical protein
MPASTSRTAASPKIAAVTSMPKRPISTVAPAIRSGALACAAPSAVARNIQIATKKRMPAYAHVEPLLRRYSTSYRTISRSFTTPPPVLRRGRRDAPP